MMHTRQYENTDKELQDALINLLAQKSFSRITVQDLIKQAKVGRSTFYEHYYSKYDLFEKMITRYTMIFQTALKLRFDNAVSDGFETDKLSALVQYLLPNRQAIVTLYHLNVDENSLEIQFRTAMRTAIKQNHTIQSYAKSTEVALDYLSALYTNIALTQVMWQLEHGQDKKIIQFTNLLVENLKTKIDLDD